MTGRTGSARHSEGAFYDLRWLRSRSVKLTGGQAVTSGTRAVQALEVDGCSSDPAQT